MSGTLPTSPAFQSVTIKSNNPNIVTISTSGRRQVKTQQSQFWSFTASYPPLTRSQWAPIAAFVVKQRGSFESFTMILPDYSTTNGAFTSQAVTTVNSEALGATAIELSAGSTTQTGALKAGDFVKFVGHNKVYMIVDDVNFSGGSATMNIEPGLTVAVSSGVAIDYIDVEFTVFLSNDVQEFNTGLASIATYELDMREAL
tara:strand:- start:37 stop:639 length:603 start_codon:yes stop_codon:yes gene_type:complete